MPLKRFYIEDIGEIVVIKRKKTKRINLRVVGGAVRVTQPYWLPFSGGLKFAQNNKNWINKQQYQEPSVIFENGQKIGLDHVLIIEIGYRLTAIVKNNTIHLKIPPSKKLSDSDVISTYKNSVARALKKEAQNYLIGRLETIALSYKFDYGKVSVKAMKSRWGSCNNRKNISLNIYLMLASWDLIDYVIVHELVHTKFMHHGKDFWQCLAGYIPDYKERQRNLKILQKSIHALQS